MKNKQNNQQGFTLMVAMLVSTIVIVVGLGISTIVLRQFNLAVLSRESQSAFYVADTLIECLRYWDLKGRIFDNIFPGNGPTNMNFVCDHTGISDDPSDADIYINIKRKADEADGGEQVPACPEPKLYKTFETSLTLVSAKGIDPIAYATIVKAQSCVEGDLYTVYTSIDTNGYNRAGDYRRTERGLGLTY